MLKLTYTENDFHLEQLTQPLEKWLQTRVILALRAGTSLFVEPSTASFLLPAHLPYLDDLEIVMQQEHSEVIMLSLCDVETIEVSLNGTWIGFGSESEEGIFITTMSDRAEFFLYKLWQQAYHCASVTGD